MTAGVVNIRGKEYQTVPLRVSQFRQLRPEWTIATHIIENTENRVVMKAEIADDKGRLIATGYAEEFRAASAINKTSALENAETSAVGRALAFLGLGGDSSIASAEEVLRAIAQQEGIELGKPEGGPAEGEEYQILSEMLDDTPEQFQLMYMKQSDDRKTEIANCAPTGKKTEWKAVLRQVEKEFHERMDYTQDQVSECVLEGRPDVLFEMLEELEAWEKPFLWARLTESEKQYIKENKQ